MNDEQNKGNSSGDFGNSGDNKLIEVTVQWFMSNIVRLTFNNKIIWETKDVALNNIINSDKKFEWTTVSLGLLEAINYSKILLQGLQIGYLEKLSELIKLRVKDWEFKVNQVEKQIIQRMIDLGLTRLDNQDEQNHASNDDEFDNFDVKFYADEFDTIDYNDSFVECKNCLSGMNSCADCSNADPDDPDNTICKGPCNKCPINSTKLCIHFDAMSCDGDCAGCKYFGKTCGGPVAPEDYPKKSDAGLDSLDAGLANDDDIFQR